MREAPIGVFDSGLGGLTAVRELRQLLPGEDIVYFGDTGRVPYGTRGRDTIVAYAKQDIAFLLSQGVKTVLAACGTVSSTLPESAAANLPVAYAGVVAPAAQAAAAATRNGRIGILGTEATIASGSYQAALESLLPGAATTAAACPLFVPLVENGHYQKDDPLVRQCIAEYLPTVRDAGVDTVILGCTHYPLLAEAIAQFFGDGVTLVNSGREAARELQGKLAAGGLLNGRSDGGSVRYYVTDDASRFDRLARIFLGTAAGGDVQRVNIEEYRLEYPM